MVFESISMIRPFRTLCAVAVLLVAGLVPLSAQATAVTYELVSGSLDSVLLVDLSGQTDPCPYTGPTDCLVDPVAIDFGSVTLDSETGQILDLNITLTGTGELNLGGMNGWDYATVTGLSFENTVGATVGDLGGGEYNFLGLAGEVTVDTLELFAMGNPGPTPDVSQSYSVSTAPGGSYSLSADSLELTLSGVDIGYFPDPVTGAMVLAVADFTLVAMAPVPESNAATLFLLGIVVAGYGTRRFGTA